MSKKRKSFIVHNDSLNILDELTNDQAGMLFKAIKDYQLGNELNLDTLTKVAFSPFKNQFERDAVKYENLCEKNRLIAESRYSTKSTSGKAGNQTLPKVTKSTDNKNDNKNDSDNDSKSKEIDIVAKAPKFNFKAELLALGVNEEILTDWLTVRKTKKASNTKTAFNGLMKEITKSGLMVNDAIEYAASKSWAGFKAQWYLNEQPTQQGAKQFSDVTAQNIKNLEGGW